MSKTSSLGVVLGIVAVLGVFFVSGESVPAYSDESSSFNRLYWERELAADGPQETYQHFLQKNAAGPFDRQHVATHVIGELLFDSEGVHGIEYCDSNFGFGCYHGFFSSAVAAEGAAIIPKLDAACVAVYGPLGTGCQHGIGHGIMEYVGYSSINDALVLCKQTTQLTTLLGCTSGVFMEYNTPLAGVGNVEAPQVRVFDSTRPYVPCTTVEPSFQESCYFELGQWFATTFSNDYAVQQKFCAGIMNDIYRERCFMGLGALFGPQLSYDVARVHEACAHMGARGEQSCHAGASWSFYADPAVRSIAPALCANADVVQQEQCLTLADLTEGLRQEPTP